jgi:hypothetical protein
MDVKQCTSAVDAIGWVPGRETAFWVPLLETRRGRILPRPVLWAPYIFINYTIGMLTGREIWGWSKTLAEIAITATAGTPSSFACSTMTFDRLDPSTQGKVRKLYAISGNSPFVAQSGFTEHAVNAAADAANLFNGAWTRLLGGSALPTVPAVALKQVRDSRDANSACYQAIVDSPVRMTRMRGGGLLQGSFALNVTTCESHQIVRDLFGRAPDPTTTTLPVRFAAWSSFDFEALPGDVIYQATRS